MFSQCNCGGLANKCNDLVAGLVSHPIAVLVLSEGTLSNGSSISGYDSYTAPSIPTFSRGSAALYVSKSLSQHPVDTRTLASSEMEVVAVQF